VSGAAARRRPGHPRPGLPVSLSSAGRCCRSS
jgi:hypothetical protein